MSCDTPVIHLISRLPSWPPGKCTHPRPFVPIYHPPSCDLILPDLARVRPTLPLPHYSTHAHCHHLCLSAVPCQPHRQLSVLPPSPLPSLPHHHHYPTPAAVQQGQVGHRVLICNPLPFVSSPGPSWRREREREEALRRGENAQLSSCHTHTHSSTQQSRRESPRGREGGCRISLLSTDTGVWWGSVHESFQL